MREANYGLTEQAFGGHNARYAADNTLLVRFYKTPMQNDAKSKEAGRPIFEEIDHIEIMQPGNKDSVVSRPATPMDKERFAEHWRKYQARIEDDHVEGTPLSEWPGVSRSQVEELRYLNIRTVEQLAAVSDSNAQKIMGVNLLKQKATAYLESAKEAAVAEALAEEREKSEKLQKQVDELAMKLELLTETKPKRRSRAAKAETEE